MKHVYILLDRSGSMESLWTEALNSINNYVNELGRSTRVTFAAFDSDGYDVLRRKKPAGEWKDITRDDIAPRNLTPLYDATAQMLNEMFEDDPRKAVFVVMTDGFENASKEYRLSDVKAKLNKAKENDWAVVFMGAEFDKVEEVSKSLGISRASTINVKRNKLFDTYSSMAVKTECYFKETGLDSAVRTMSWSADEKAEAEGK